MSFTVSHIIDTDVDGLWQLFFDLDLARAIFQVTAKEREVHQQVARDPARLSP